MDPLSYNSIFHAQLNLRIVFLALLGVSSLPIPGGRGICPS